MKKSLAFSLFLNAVLVAGMVFIVQRLGGWKFALGRLNNSVPALYSHRRQLFEQLPERPGSIIFLGDSQTEQGEWQELAGNDSTMVLNRGISGDYVDGVWMRLDEVLRHKPLKIYLLIGTNDLLFHKPLPAIETRYREIVQKIRLESSDTELILESILPVNNNVRYTGTTNQEVQAFNVRIAQIAKEYALTYLDIYAPLTDASGNLSTQFTEDGIHLNGLGYLVWKNKVRIEN